MDYYKILGVSQNANEEEIKAAYKALAQKYNIENYEAGPLRDEAAAKMNEVNEAFDALMGSLRAGPGAQSFNDNASTTADSSFADIRALINRGDADGALQRLHAVPNGSDIAEWNFLVGSANYYKGWLADAMRYFEAACRLEPSNHEYEAALRNMRQSANGQMHGNPYANPYGQGAPRGGMGCSCCDMCTAMMCMDMCCGCGNGC